MFLTIKLKNGPRIILQKPKKEENKPENPFQSYDLAINQMRYFKTGF